LVPNLWEGKKENSLPPARAEKKFREREKEGRTSLDKREKRGGWGPVAVSAKEEERGGTKTKRGGGKGEKKKNTLAGKGGKEGPPTVYSWRGREEKKPGVPKEGRGKGATISSV